VHTYIRYTILNIRCHDFDSTNELCFFALLIL
jgi:hypothetical protein